MWGNPALFYSAKSIEKLSRNDKCLYNQLSTNNAIYCDSHYTIHLIEIN